MFYCYFDVFLELTSHFLINYTTHRLLIDYRLFKQYSLIIESNKLFIKFLLDFSIYLIIFKYLALKPTLFLLIKF